MHLPQPRADPGIPLRQVHGTRLEARGGNQAGQPAGRGHHAGRAGVHRAARKDPVLPGHRQAGRRRRPGRRIAGPVAGRAGRRLLRAAHGVQGPQQDARVPGGNLRAGGGGDDVQGRRRRAGAGQRHALRTGRGRVVARREHLLPDGTRHQGRPRMDQLLSRLPRACGVWWIQAVGHRA
ncbi:hypothetical protein D3C85_1362560 [compost metagenome]